MPHRKLWQCGKRKVSTPGEYAIVLERLSTPLDVAKIAIVLVEFISSGDATCLLAKHRAE